MLRRNGTRGFRGGPGDPFEIKISKKKYMTCRKIMSVFFGYLSFLFLSSLTKMAH